MKIVLFLFISFIGFAQNNEKITKENYKKENGFGVLIFTETKGFVHREAIPAGIKLITKLGKENKFNVYQTKFSEEITAENLNKINAIIFLNTTLDVLNDNEQNTLKKFIQNGGGFLGIHSAADTEYNWEWYGRLIGAYFKSHPKIQNATITTVNKAHISTKHLEATWEIEDEWYNFKDFNPNINVLLNLEESSYKGGTNGSYHPIAWYHDFDGGRSFYIGLGHKASTYEDKRFAELVRGGIFYVSKN